MLNDLLFYNYALWTAQFWGREGCVFVQGCLRSNNGIWDVGSTAGSISGLNTFISWYATSPRALLNKKGTGEKCELQATSWVWTSGIKCVYWRIQTLLVLSSKPPVAKCSECEGTWIHEIPSNNWRGSCGSQIRPDKDLYNHTHTQATGS